MFMLKSGILNPQLNSLLSRVRHTNTLVIADRGFPFWQGVDLVDITLVDDIPRVLDVLRAISGNFSVGRFFMAEEFRRYNSEKVQAEFSDLIGSTPIDYEPHMILKRRVPDAVGIIRTADTTPYANIILASG
jgi:D-ribose pyranase